MSSQTRKTWTYLPYSAKVEEQSKQKNQPNEYWQHREKEVDISHGDVLKEYVGTFTATKKMYTPQTNRAKIYQAWPKTRAARDLRDMGKALG